MAGNLRQLALVGTAVAVTGGVAYVVWRNYRAPKGPPGSQPPRQPSPERARLDCAQPPLEQEKTQSKQILVLGLDGAGKTSILHSLTANQVKHSTAPTEGFNAVCVSTEDSKMEFLERDCLVLFASSVIKCKESEIANKLFMPMRENMQPKNICTISALRKLIETVGGSESLRSYWKMYLSRVLLLIYVVDSADHKRLPMAKKLLHQLVQDNSTLPVMILANKQDLEGAYCITDIHEALALSDIGDERKMFLIATHVAEDGSEITSGMKDTRELIAGLVSEAM